MGWNVVVLVVLGTFSFWYVFLERVELLSLGHLGKSQNSLKVLNFLDFQNFSDFFRLQTFPDL